MASLKMLWRPYLEHQRGGQQVGIYSPPVDNTTWVFDEITGATSTCEPKVDKVTEVYPQDQRKVISTALAQAPRAATGAVSKLGSPTPATLAMLRTWFADEDTTDAQRKVAARKPLAGFKKIANVCNSNHLIWSDEPIDRRGGGWKHYAFVDLTETLNVVYAQGAFLRAAGSTGRVWLCVETIVHERSHRVATTDDFAHDNTGLRPSKSGITFGHAIRNADSWGYFCVDLAGLLADADRTKVLGKGTLLKAALTARTGGTLTMKKIAAPEDVEPVTIGKTRYEAPHWGKTLGFAQDGGHVSAVDVVTGKTLWTVELYKIDYKPNMEADKQDVFIVEMKPSADGRALLLIDDRGRRWKVDLASHAAERDNSP